MSRNEGCDVRRVETSEPDRPESQVPGPRLDQVPTVTAAEMREVDRAMVEDLGIDLIQMMENAGRNLADLALTRFGPSDVVVLAGSGGNGGGGLVAARHLANRGVAVLVVPSGSDLAPVPEHQLDILRRMGVQVSDEPAPADLVIDALIGYSLRSDPRGTAADLITWANRRSSPVLALDTPSGLDVTTGAVGDPCVRATATMTLALPKSGLILAPEVVGELYLADISVPPLVYERMGFEVPALFGGAAVVRIAGLDD